MQLGEDGVQLADYHLEHPDLLMQKPPNMFFNGPLGGKIKDIDIFGLSQSMHPPDPLLKPHGIPRQIEVNHIIAVLEINAFTAGFSADQYITIPPKEELGELLAAS